MIPQRTLGANRGSQRLAIYEQSKFWKFADAKSGPTSQIGNAFQVFKTHVGFRQFLANVTYLEFSNT